MPLNRAGWQVNAEMLPLNPTYEQEHLASVQGGEADDVKAAIKSFLRSSGNALKLQNLAYALKHGLVLPFDAAPEHPSSELEVTVSNNLLMLHLAYVPGRQ